MIRALIIFTALWLGGLPASGCGDNGGASVPDAAGRDTSLADARLPDGGLAPLGPEEAALAGSIVNGDGEPAAGLKVLCCNLDLCLTADTQADGTYLFWAIEAGPRKMEIIDPMGRYAMMMFHQVAVEGAVADLPRAVVAPAAIEESQPWEAAEGGTVVLLDGALTLTVGPGQLHYPAGTAEENLGARQLQIEDLPPSEREPWVGAEEQSFAFLFNPISLRSEAPIALRFTPPTPLREGAVYRIWTVDKILAELVDAGSATVMAGGDIESDMDAELLRVSMLFLVPEPAEG